MAKRADRARRRLTRGLAAVGVLTASVMTSTGTANAQAGPAVLEDVQSVSQPTAAPLFTDAAKSDTLGSLGPGQADTYTITGSNPVSLPLDGFTTLESLPAALTMVQDGAPNLTGAGTPPLVRWRPLGGGSFQAIGTSPSGGGWGATLPSNANEIQLAYGTVPAGFSATARVRAGLPASGIGRDGVPFTTGTNIRNCITVSGSSPSNPVLPRSSCTDQTVTPLSVQFHKVRSSSPVVAPGGGVTWAISLGVEARSAADLVDPVITDCLPPGIDLIDPSNPTSALNGSSTGLSPAPVLSRTPSACGLSQVLLTWSWPAPFTLARGVSGTLTLHTRVSNTVAPTTATNSASLSGANLGIVVQRTAEVTVTTPPTPTCGSRAVTVDLAHGDQPTERPDVIQGTSRGDVIRALGGADMVCGLGGDDIIDGGLGDDVILGGPGRDLLRGGRGNDRLLGGPGRDSCWGGGGRDSTVSCEAGRRDR